MTRKSLYGRYLDTEKLKAANAAAAAVVDPKIAMYRELAEAALRVIEIQRAFSRDVLAEIGDLETRETIVMRRILAERLRELPREETYLRELCAKLGVEL